METTSTRDSTAPSSSFDWVRDRVARAGELGSLLGTTALPFALVLYLALEGGGYDPVVRSEVGIAVWWLVLLGAAVGFLPVRRIGWQAWTALGLLGAYAVWTGLGISWSESSERSVAELARVATLLGVLALAVSVQGRDGLRRTSGAVAAAIAVVGTLALLSRLHPSWFPPDNPAHFITGTRGRLNYPLDYWNGLAALMALGMPLLLVIATRSRRLVTQALAAAAIPVLALTAFYTFSRGGAVEIAASLLALILLYPARLSLLPTLVLGGAGGTLAIAAATQRDALENGLSTPLAQQQGNEMLAFMLVVCVGVALLRVALGLAARHEVGPRSEVSRKATVAGFGAAALAAVVVALAAGVPSELSSRWDEFRSPDVNAATGVSRFDTVNGSGRYQQWQAAADAGGSAPLTGIGPGTYEFWWARNATTPAFVRDAHSLYLEAYAELGIVGVLLIVGLIGGVLGLGIRGLLSAAGDDRAYLAAAVAAVIAFAVGAALDWVWELTVLPVAFLLLAGALVASPIGRRRGGPDDDRESGGGRRWARIVLAAAAVPAIVAIAIPMAATSSVRESQADVRAGDLVGGLDAAKGAAELQPYAATPHLQEALVLEAQGDLDGAAEEAQAATRAESTNWRTWLTLSRVEAERGDARASVAAYGRADSLNPSVVALASGGTS